jgi:hypothetical protein
MPFIGNKPTAVPLSGADIEDGTIGLADLSATGTKDATTFLRGDNTFATAGESNVPYFRAFNNADFSFSSSSTTKMRMNQVAFETNSGSFDTTNYRFTVPTGEGGKYFLNSRLWIYSGTNCYASGYIFKNNSEFNLLDNIVRDDYGGSLFVQINTIIDLSAGDYVDVRVNSNIGSPQMYGDTSTSYGYSSFFEGFKLSSS